MKIRIKYVFFFAAVSAVLFSSGCLESRSSKGVDSDDSIAQKRFAGSAANKSAADVAIDLSEKYAALVEEAAAMKEKIKSLSAENDQLKEKLTSTLEKLKQTETELEDANELLLEMRIELNNWKTDVLGFRDEMRNAEQAQLEALMKIAEILGGEVTEPNQPENSQGDSQGE